MRSALLTITTVCLVASATGCTTPASIAVHPVTGHVLYTTQGTVHVCNQAAAECSSTSLGFKPIDATFTDAGVVFLTLEAVYRCDKDGQNCSPGTPLTFKDAAGISTDSAGQVVVVSHLGELNTCNATSCSKPKSK